jgi:glycosyltransferase involved in cell wall biosynthesis
MKRVDCPIVLQHVRRWDEPPLLSIVVPTYNRTPDMIAAVRSIADQLEGGLETKVEIVLSDNASGPPGREAILQLASDYPAISYYINAEDQGGMFQTYAAPWRAQGRWTWVFGSDDVLFPGGVAEIVRVLEAEAPSFLTMNKRILNRDLSQERLHAVNGIPNRRFDNFVDLMCGVGIHQLCFMSSSLERTDAARALDATPYRAADTYHSYVIAYLAKHRHAPCGYTSANHLGHRTDNSSLHDYGGVTAEDIGVKFPLILMSFREALDLPWDLYERINGSRYIDTYDPPSVTYVDNMLEYMLRAVASGRYINEFNRVGMEALLEHCRPGRVEQFRLVWRTSEDMRKSLWTSERAREEYERQTATIAQRRREVFDFAIKTFTDKRL